MPIKSLESYLFERKLVSTSSIQILQNATIGIDVEHYLSRIYTYKKEQFLFSVGGVPSSLKSYIESDLKVFKEFNIRPLFVFPGLHICSQQQVPGTNELTPQEQHLESTWTKLYSKHSNPNNTSYVYLNESFRLPVDPLPIRTMMNDLIKYLIANGIDYIISPYNASFQLSYLHQAGIIDSIYGSTDILLTNADKFILGMEFQSKDFRFVDKRKVLSELDLSERQFCDLSIMVGCSVQPETFSNLPPLPKPNPMSPYQQLSYFRIALDIFYQYNTFCNGTATDIYGYLSGLHDESLLELYFAGHAALKYMPVINTDGQISLYFTEMAKFGFVDEADVLKNEEEKETGAQKQDTEHKSSTKAKVVPPLKVPTEIHNVVSQRLPPEIYFYQSLGLLPVKLLEAITLGRYIVRPPLEMGLGDGYKKLITSPLAENTLDYQFNLITQSLARYYQVKKIDVKYWFREEPLQLNNRLTPPMFMRLNHLVLKNDDIKEFSLKSFFSILPTKFDPSSKPDTRELKTKDLVSSAFLRALFVLGAINNTSNEINSVPEILKKFVNVQPDVSSAVLQELTLLLMLLNTGSLKLCSYDRSYPGVLKSFKFAAPDLELSSEENEQVALISRIFSLHKLNIHPINYQGPISRSLLNFRSHIVFIQNLLATSTQTCLVDMIVRQDALKLSFDLRKDWYELVDQLPFYMEPNNTLLGVVGEIFFDHCIKLAKAGESPANAKKKSNDYLLDQVFQVGNPSFNINLNSSNSVTPHQLQSDFQEGLKLWRSFVQISQIAHDVDPKLFSKNDLDFIEKTNALVARFT